MISERRGGGGGQRCCSTAAAIFATLRLKPGGAERERTDIISPSQVTSDLVQSVDRQLSQLLIEKKSPVGYPVTTDLATVWPHLKCQPQIRSLIDAAAVTSQLPKLSSWSPRYLQPRLGLSEH